MQPANRALGLFSGRLPATLQPSALSGRLAAVHAAGMAVDLTVSNPTRAGFRYPEASIRAAFAGADWLSYDPHPCGLPSARAAVARYISRERGRVAHPERVLLTASTSEAYGLLLKLLCDPGDRVVAPAPSYPLMQHLAELEGVRLERYTWHDDVVRWAIDLDEVAAAVADPRCRALVLVAPNNPTGSSPSADEAKALLRLCAAHDVALIIDEVFAPYGWADDAAAGWPVPFAFGESGESAATSESLPLVFTCDGLSKGAALPHLKLAWIAVDGPPTRVAQAMEALGWLADATLSVASPVQQALPALLTDVAPVMQAQIRERVRANLARLRQRVALLPAVRVVSAQGGWVAVLRVPCVMDEAELVATLAEVDRVIVQPGFFYDFAREGYLVVSLLPAPTLFEQGLSRLISAFERLF